MKKVITLSFLILLVPLFIIAQESTIYVYPDNTILVLNDGNTDVSNDGDLDAVTISNIDHLIIYPTKTDFTSSSLDKRNFIKFDETCDGSIQDLGTIKYTMNCGAKTVEIWNTAVPNKKLKATFCSNTQQFTTGDCTITTNQLDNRSTLASPEVNNDIINIPYPLFRDIREVLIESEKNRYLVIDANPNLVFNFGTVLWKRTDVPVVEGTPITTLFEKAKSLPANNSLGVFLRGYNLKNIEDITITVAGEDFSYGQDISDIFKASKKILDASDDETAEAVREEEFNPSDSIEDKRKAYLTKVHTLLNDIEYLSINDISVLEAYKNTLETTLSSNPSITLDDNSVLLLSEILSWYPKWVSLTPKSVNIPDADEIEINASVKTKNVSKAKTQLVGQYKVSGSLSFNLGALVYLTGLKNNDVYTETVMVDGNEELRATMNDDNQTSVGIGMNGEVVFRTGGMVSPTFNAGFFIPFEEELTPYFTLGPGINIATGKVKLSLSGGIATGKINTIAERYEDRDLSIITDLTNETLTEKVWDASWYIGFGLSFNLNNKD